jgi:hypothetical protein
MSGGQPSPADIEAAQAFVRKPFTMAAVVATMKSLLKPAA